MPTWCYCHVCCTSKHLLSPQFGRLLGLLLTLLPIWSSSKDHLQVLVGLPIRVSLQHLFFHIYLISLIHLSLFRFSILFKMSFKPLPTFDELPMDKKGPFLNAWGL